MPREGQDAPKQPQLSCEQQHAVQGDAFVRHLEHASTVVQSWPVWKQQILGGNPTPPANLSAQSNSDRR